MFLDTDTLPAGHTLTADVAIFGSGPAGLTLAKTLADRGLSVIVAEGGGFSYEDRSQDLYQGAIVGDMPMELEASRLRMFGGSSNHWGGYSRPLDAIDFEERAWLAHTGWPISKAELDPYEAAASEILEVQPAFADQQRGDLIFADYGYSPPVVFGDKYHDEIEASENLTVVMNANFNRVTLDGNRITSAEVRGYNGGSWQIEAREFALCMGGIENPRMLMWANIQSDYQLVGPDDQIGRYWMEHPDIFVGQALLVDPSPELFKTGSFFRDGPQAFVSLSPALQEEHGVANFMFNIRIRGNSKGLMKDLLCVAPGLGMRLIEATGRTLICGAEIHAQLEQLPDPNNRVLLDQARDALGVPKTALHWEYERETNAAMLTALEAMGVALAEEDIGRVRMLDWGNEGRMPPRQLLDIHKHHMGGTRMSASPETGVVDANCKVWGCDNLYMGGSSVFTTGGYANPTYAIVQLALRLADHLESRVKTTL